MKVYLVTSGAYSDYHVDKVFLDESKAKQWIAARNDSEKNSYHDEYSIEEYDSADDDIDCVLKLRYMYIEKVFVKFTDDGFVKCVLPNVIPYPDYTHTVPSVSTELRENYAGKYFLVTLIKDEPFNDTEDDLKLYKKILSDEIHNYAFYRLNIQ